MGHRFSVSFTLDELCLVEGWLVCLRKDGRRREKS